MPTDVIIEPGSGQIYWNDSAGSSQSISIKGDAQNTISVVGYSGAFSPGSSAGGTFVIASFNDNSGTSAFVPGTTNYDLGSTTYRWSVYGYTGNFSSDVVISSSTQSTSVTSGALRVNGGVGISGRMYFNTAAMGTTGIASPPTFAFIGSTGDPIYLQVLEDNSIAFEGSQGQLFSITPNLSTGYIYSVNDITGIPLLRANANANVTANEFGGNFGIGVTNPGYKLHVVGSVGFTSVTASTSPTTGTLVVSGGVGIGQTLNIGGRLNLWNSANTNFTSFVSTATGNTVYNLPATTPATGSSVLQSDSVGNLSWVGFVANSAATATTAQNINSVVASTSGTHFILFSPVNGGSGIAVSSDSGFTVNPATNVITANTFSGNISATGTTSGFVGVTDATSTTSTTTGALVVTGGVGIGQSVIIGGRVGIGTAPNLSMLNIQTSSAGTTGLSISASPSQSAPIFEWSAATGGGRIRSSGELHLGHTTGFTLSSGATALISLQGRGGNEGLAIRGFNSGSTEIVFETQGNPGNQLFAIFGDGGVNAPRINVTNSTGSTNTSTGALIVAGGVGIGGSLYVASATAISGVTINAGVITGTLSGYATTARNTDVSVASTNATHYITFTTASSGSGLGQSADNDLTYNPSTNLLTSGTFSGNLSATATTTGLANVTNTSASTSTTTGALVVSGGVGIAQTAFIGGNVNILGSTASTYMANGTLTVAGGVGISGQLSFNRAAMGYTGIASNPTMAFIGTTGSPITLTVLSDNGLQFEGTSGKLFGINNNLSTGWIFNVGDISGLPLIRANADGTVAMGEFAGNIGIGMSNPAYKLHVIGSVGFTSVTASTNPTSGTLVVSGGVGIGQSLNVGGRLHLWNAANTNFTAFLSAAIANHTYTLPANVPSTGTSVLQADTSGILSWVGFSANSASIATTAQNLNTVAATTSATHYLLFSPVNGASGVAVSSDTELSYNPSTNVLSASVFSGNISATAVTSTNFFGTLTGNVTGNVTGTSTTSQNVNTVAATTSASHYLTFSPVNGASGVALSSDVNLTFNPATNVLTTDIFSGNASGTAATYTNFFGTHVGPVTGNVTGTATTSQNINLAAGANNSNHSVVFSLNASGSGVALSSDAGLQYNPSTNVLTADVFSGNVSATAVTATNFFGTFQGSSATAITSQNINTTSAATSASHYILFSPVNATTSGVAVSSDASLQFNPATNVLTVDVFSGNLSATAATATNFFGTHVGPVTGNVTGNVTGTATTSQNVNTVAATTSATHYLTFSPVNGASGVALSSDANLTFNPSTNVLTTDVFSGNVSATAVTSTNFFGTLTGNVTGNLTGTATTAQNVNLAAGANASNHSVVFSLNATGTGIALSSDAGLQYNPSTNVLTADVFSGNVTGTAATYTNFYGTHVGAVTGNVTGNVTGTATTSQNINTTTATTAGAHYLLFSPVNATASGVAVSSDAQLQFNPGTNVLTADVFSGNVSATAVTSTNFFGTLTGNVTGVATTAQSINLAAGANNSNHSVVFSLNATGTGIALSSDAGLQYNPSTNVLTADVFSGNVTGTAITATNFFGTFQGSAATAVTAQNVNVNATTINATHFITFTPASSGSGLANSTDTDLTYNPGSNVLTAGVFSGNASGTAATYTNFFGTHVGAVTGNVTGNVTGTATTSQNINTTSATTAGAHYILFSPVNATASGVAVSSDSTLQFNPGTNVLTTDVFSGNLSATAATATNFFGTLVGNSSTATTAANMNVVAASTNSAHYITFSPASSGSGLATSADADLAYNPSTNVLTAGVFSGNLSATAATATNFFGTLVGNSSTATTATNVNLAAGANASNHSIVFSLNATGSGVALSSDAELQYNPSTNALSVGTGNITANTVRIGNTANTIDTSSGNLTLDSTGGQINLNDNVVVQGNLTVQGTTLTVDSTVSTFVDPVVVLGSGVGGTHSTTDNNQDRGIEFRYSNSGTAVTGFFGFQDTDFKFKYIPNATLSGTNVYSGTVGVIVANIEGNVSGAAVTATNFYGTLVGNSSTATTSRNVNTVSATTSTSHFLLFSPVNGASGVAVSSDTQLTYNPATDVLSATTFSGNVSATAVTATNFFGTLVGNTATATTSQNINTTAATTAGAHYLLFSPVNATASGVAVSSDSTLQFNPGTNVLTTDVFSGNLSATAATATNFFGTHVGPVTGNVTGTATTSQNINTVSATTSASHFLLFSPVNGASGVAVSSDTQLSYNPATDVLSSTTFSGNLSGTAVTSTNFFGTLTGNVTGTATTATNINLAAGANNSNHSVIFSLNATGTGVGLSSDAGLQYNPSTNVLTTDVFSGNFTGTAATATNFFGTHVGPVTGNVTGTATTSQNINTVSATTSASHFVLFSPVNGASGVAVSSDTQLTYNPNTDILSATTFSGALTGTATTAQNVNVVAATTAATHFVTFSPASSGSGLATSADTQLTYNPATDVLSAATFSGNVTGTAITATNFFGTHVGAVTGNVTGTATTSQNINTTAATTAGVHYLLFSPVNATASGVAVSSDATLQFNPGTNVLTTDVFSGNLSATAATATNFFGTHVGPVTGNVTGNLTGTATTSQNVNTVSATTSASHFLLFSPVNGASGVALSSDTQLTYNPATDVLSASTFSGNLSATAATATNFFGTLTGNVTGNLTGTATTAQNINVNATTINATHYITFSPASSGSGLATSTDTDLSYNPGSNVLSAGVFSGNVTGTAVTATNFFGTLTGNVTGTATTAQNINLAAGGNNSNHSVVFSLNATGTGVGLSSDGGLQYNPSTHVLTTDVFSGNFTGTAATATNFFGTLVGNSSTATTSRNVNTVAATTAGAHFITFSPVNGASGVALSSDAQLTYNPATDVLAATTFSGNVTGTAITATNFYGTLIGSVGTATTSQNINTTAATTAGVHYLLFSPVNATASGVAVSSDATLQFNPGTNVLTTDVFSGNLSATAATATNFFGTHVGPVTGNVTGNVTGTATTAQNVNVVAATTAATHFVTFSPASSGSGLATSADTQLTYNPATDVLSSTTFSGNLSGTAVTATNFFGTLTGNVTGTSTTSQNINTTAATTAGVHYLLFSPVNATASGVAVSSDSTLQFNPGTNVLTTDVFSGNLSATAATATNFFGSLTGNVTGTATTAQNINLAAGANNSNHSVVFSLNATGTGVGLSSDAGLQYNPSTNVLTSDVFSGNFTGTAATATNFFGTLVGNSSTATTSRNVNTVAATTSAAHYITFSPANGASGVALSSDAQLTYNPATDVLSATTFSGNVTGTAITATNFYGTLVGSVGTATTSQNINTTAATTAGVHYLLFSPVNATASGVAVSSDATLQFNPGTNVLTTDVFSGNLSATAATAANFYGTHIGNVTGTATTAQNVNTVSATTSSVHYITFSPINGASGVALSSDAQLTYNPATDVLSSTTFSGNVTGTAITATNFFGSLTGTATTSQNINTTAATTAGTHYLLFSPVNATASGIAVSSDATLQFNPGTNVLTTDVFSGNLSATAATATNFYGTHIGNVTGTATTAQNVNLATGANNSNHSVIFSLNATGTGVGLSSDAGLQYNPSTNVLTADVFNGNVTGTAITATNFFGTHVGAVTGNVTGTATTSQNVNTVSANTSVVHYITFSPVNGASGVALSSDAQLTYNPATDVVSATTFSGNVTGTAITATNFYGTLVGSVGTATTSQNINTTAATTAGVHYLLFSPVNATASGVAVSSDATLQFNPGTNVLTTDVFSGNLSGTAATATNFYGTHIGNVTGTATTAQNINLAAGSNNSNHSVIFSLNATGTGVGLSSDAGLQYNPSTNVLTADVFSGNFTGTAATATNFFGTHVGPVTGNVTGNVTGTATTSQNLNTVAATTAGNHFLLFSPVNGASGVAVSSDATLQFNPATNVLTTDVFSGNVSGTAVTATNFFGTLTGNVTGTATTAQNINLAAGANNSNHSVVFSLNATGTGVGLSSDAGLQYNPSTNVLTADVFSGNVTGTAITATNFYGTHVGAVTGNVTGTATTAQNVNVVLATTAATHFITFSPASSGSGLATSADTQLTYNPATDVLSATTFSGNVTGTAITATNFYGTLVGSVGTATTSANINTVAATTAGVHYLTFSPVNGASGVALSSDASLQFNPGTNVLTTDVFSGNLSATATTSGFVKVSDLTPSFSTTTGALVVTGGVGIGGSIFTSPTSKSSISGVSFNNSRAENGFTINASSSYTFNIQDPANNQRLNYHADSNRTEFTGNNATHEIRLIHSNNSGYTGFKANSSGAVTYTLPAGDGSNGQLLQTNGTGTLSWATVSGGAGSGSSGVNAGGQYQLAYYASTGGSVDGSSTFTNNTSTSTVTISHGTSSTATNIGALVVTGGLGLGGNAFIGGTVTITNSTASTTTANGALVVTGGLGVGAQINSASIVTSGNAVFNGNLQFKGTGTFGDNAAADTIAYNARSTTDFNPSTSNSVDLGFNTLVWRNLFANFITGSAVTATNFYGTLAGNVTGTATTSQNINSVAATTAGAHYILFSPVNGASGVAVSSEATLQFNPGTNVLTTDVFSGNLSATAATATNFYGTHIGNVTGTSTTSQNINTTAATTAGAHYLLFSPVNATASGVAVSSDATLQFNPGTNVLTTDVFSGNLSATAATSGRFAVGNLTYAAANLLAAFQSSVNSYNQVVIQNSNNGASASSDLVVNNDISTDTGAFGTFGMNSSGFTGLGSTNIPNAVYVTAATAELVLGTTTNNRIRFVNENVDTFQITATGSSVYTTTATLSRNSGAFVVAGGAAIGLSLSVGQGIQLYNSTNGNHTGFKAGATSANSVYTLPLAYPSTGSSILQSDTAGTMIWVNAPTGGSATPAGNTTELQYNNAGAFGGATGLTWQAVNNTLQINSNASHTTSTQVGLRLENGLASGGQATRWSPTFEMVGRSGIANVYFSRFAAEVVPSGPATYASALRFKYSQDQGTASYSSNIFSIHSTLGIGIGGSTVSSNFMSYIRAHESQAADIFYKLPLAAPGTGASFLQCDTSGNMSWVNSPGGGSGSPAGSPKQIQFNNNGAFGGAGGFEYITVGGSAVTVSMFSVAGGGYTSGLWVNVLSASSTRIGIGLSNPQYELEINGELSATNKSFVINHPTKPGMKLRYGSLEGPENGVYVRGELNGSNIIEVPDHWIGLVHEDSYTVHLTPIGRYSQLYVEKIENYNVYVADNFMNPIHCYYSVWAERKDIPKLVTEY